MIRKKSLVRKIIQWTFVFLFSSFLLYRFIDSTINQHSGPFAYFKNFPGEGSAFNRGKAEINRWADPGIKGLEVIEKARKAGFSCKPFHIQFDAKPTTNLIANCRYKFGFFGEDWYFSVLTDANYTVININQNTTPLFGL
jgi:hypothetical protein